MYILTNLFENRRTKKSARSGSTGLFFGEVFPITIGIKKGQSKWIIYYFNLPKYPKHF